MGRKLLSVLTPDSLSLSLSDGGNVPSQPIDESTLVLSPGDLVALGARPVFVFRPGGVAGGNVYTDWLTMMADVVVQQGPKWIEIDGRFAAAHVPAGTWNVDQCTFVGQQTFVSNLIFDEGAKFTYVLLTVDACNFTNNSTTSVASPASLGTLRVLNGAKVSRTAGAFAPWLRATAGVTAVVVSIAGVIGSGGTADAMTADAGGTLFMDLGVITLIAQNALSGLGTATILSDASSVVNGTQTVSVLTNTLQDNASRVLYGPAVAGNWQPAPTLTNAALDQLAAPNVLAEVNAAPIGAAGTITYTSVATLAKKKSGKVRLSISISVTSSGIAGLDFRMYRDTVSGPNQLPPHGFESNTVALSARFTCTLDWVDTLPDAAAHAYVMQVIADAGTVALANGDCAVVANEL